MSCRKGFTFFFPPLWACTGFLLYLAGHCTFNVLVGYGIACYLKAPSSYSSQLLVQISWSLFNTLSGDLFLFQAILSICSPQIKSPTATFEEIHGLLRQFPAVRGIASNYAHVSHQGISEAALFEAISSVKVPSYCKKVNTPLHNTHSTHHGSLCNAWHKLPLMKKRKWKKSKDSLWVNVRKGCIKCASSHITLKHTATKQKNKDAIFLNQDCCAH